MDSDDDYLYEATDSGNESPEGEDSEDQVKYIYIFYDKLNLSKIKRCKSTNYF